MVVRWSTEVRPSDVKVAIEIDQQAQSDGLSKIKAVNKDPVSYPGWIQQLKTILKHSSSRRCPRKGCSR